MDHANSPLVIGAIGGSGTRLLAHLARHAGRFMGSNVNRAEDALSFVSFYDRWILPWLLRPGAGLNESDRLRMREEFRACVRQHRETIPDGRAKWGWKNPRSIYLLDFLDQEYPQMKFLHVVRDGRDMAYSKNQKQLKLYGKTVLGEARRKLSPPLRRLAFWSSVNVAAADYGESQMGSRYLRIRYEELCARPAGTIPSIFDFLEAHGTNVQAAVAEVIPPETIGRWRRQPREELAEIGRVSQEALVRLGYTEGKP